MSREHVYTDLPSIDVAFDVDAFNEAVRSQGVKLVHFRAQRCPVGMVDLDDNRRPHPHHENCFNGFVYTQAGCVTALMTSNNKKKSLEEVGFVDFSTVQVTFPQTYDGTDTKIVIAPFDRFYLDESSALVVQWQLFRHHETGLDRLKFPVKQVEGAIIDARGTRYSMNDDFVITPEGLIKWIGKRPEPELDVGPGLGNGFGTDRGVVCSIRYLYRPYWYVGTIPHEIRMVQVQDGFDRRAERGPQMCVMHREYVSQNIEQNEDGVVSSSSDELKRVMAPMYGGFGAK